MRTGRRCQPDLFQTDPPPLELLPEQRDKLMALLQVLLLEAAAAGDADRVRGPRVDRPAAARPPDGVDGAPDRGAYRSAPRRVGRQRIG